MFYSLKITFDEKIYEEFYNFLINLGIDSFEEGETIINETGDLELVSERTLITVRNENLDEIESLIKSIANNFVDIKVEKYVEESDYLDEWKKFSKQIWISDLISITPKWLIDEVSKKAKIEIILDPGYAFGSGSHETTILCARAIENCVSELGNVKSLLDVGCGSGVLSIIASKLGVEAVLGTDIDQYAIDASYENAIANQVNNIEFSVSKLSEIENQFEIVVANIISSVLYELKSDILKKVSKNGILILSGILKEEVEEVAGQFNLIDYKSSVLGDWASIVCWIK